ncbi:uncharacterized protein LOC135384833 [Ornithodoros turicata]|uniref:uncharacterized protein LOC135384833 n=1 Tax=Ornithodoros turicata TaxID=34597 RepID=UPI003138E29B
MRSFSTFPSYRKHVYRKHEEAFQDETNTTFVGEGNQDHCGTQSHHDASEDVVPPPDMDTTDTDMGTEDRDEQHLSDTMQSDHVRQLALLLLKWKESKRLAESTLNEIANDIICYVQGVADDWMMRPEPERTGLMSAIGEQMQTLSTQAGRTDYWKLYLPFVEPRTVVLGTNEHGRCDQFHYVPICEALRNILEVPVIYSDFCRSQREANYLSTVFDGKAFQNHSYFKGDEKKICVQLYADEFEVCDPLGSKRDKHKLLGVYFSILNLPRRSTLSHMHLVLLVKDKHASAYGMDKVFSPLLQDIANLETEGITVNGDTLKGTVFIMTGDNLSSHRIAGFKCSFSGGRICRFCLALRHEINYKHQETDFVLRTPEGHRHHLEMLKNGIPTVSLYGVREPCALNFSGFEPTDHFPPDVMHDVLEGVVPFAMKHIIAHLITSGNFSLIQLNQRIEEYSYEQCDMRNKPENISRDFLQGKACMKGTASQVFCFFRHFSLYVGDCVPSGNAAWELYLLLREIVDIVMCRKLPTSYVPYLQRLITFFYHDFQALFSGISVPCKMHYLVHYPSFIFKYGPLVNIWAMRFESKHQYFKDMTRKLRNFKNVTRMLAVRHQYLQAYELSQSLNQTSPFVTSCRPVLLEHMPDVLKSFIQEKGIVAPSISVVKSVRIDNVLYVPGMSLLYSVSHDKLPEFAQICGIFTINRRIIFHMRELVTVEFDSHYHFYVVTHTDKCFVQSDIWTLGEPLFPTWKGDQCVINPRRALL